MRSGETYRSARRNLARSRGACRTWRVAPGSLNWRARSSQLLGPYMKGLTGMLAEFVARLGDQKGWRAYARALKQGFAL